MEQLAWVFLLAPKYNHMYPYKTRSRGRFYAHTRAHALARVKMEQREVEWFEVANLSIGLAQPLIQGCWHLQELEGANNDSPLQPPEGAWPCQHLDLTWDPDLGLAASRTVKVQRSIVLSHKFVVTFFFFCTAAQEAMTWGQDTICYPVDPKLFTEKIIPRPRLGSVAWSQSGVGLFLDSVLFH